MQEDFEEGVSSSALVAAPAQEHTLLPAKGPCERKTNSHSCVTHGSVKAQPYSVLNVQRDAGVRVSKGFSAQPPMPGQGAELAKLR